MALAFIPIAGRPMDKMIMSFLTAIPKENRYVYRKTGVNLLAYAYFQPVKSAPQKKLEQKTDASAVKKSLLLAQLRNSSFKPDEQEMAFMSNIKSFFEETAFTPGAKPITATVPAPQEQPEPVPQTPPAPQAARHVPLPQNQAPDIEEIKEELAEAQEEVKKGHDSKELEAKIEELQKELQQALQDKQSLEQQMLTIAREQKQQPVYTPSPASEKPTTQNVHVVDSANQLSAGFPSLPDMPNIMLGIVKDPRGKVLPGIVVEVVDTNNIPVRAFKTNSLGQFMAATPLSNGTYRISFEDPLRRHEFETVEVSLTGEIVQPIEVISTDQREKLRRELFGAA